ncbi:MAG: hypothetical protein M1529_02405, partial [Candidatus Thermoplasmatota archaeon]|nr:hypothetical protein [Candidatus Thermoplasmatota archaeon]
HRTRLATQKENLCGTADQKSSSEVLFSAIGMVVSGSEQIIFDGMNILMLPTIIFTLYTMFNRINIL